MPEDKPYRPRENLSEQELISHLSQDLGTSAENLKITLETLRVIYLHKYLLSYDMLHLGELRDLIKVFSKPLTQKQKKAFKRENRKLARMRKKEHDRKLMAQAVMKKRKDEEKKRVILKLPDEKLVNYLEDLGSNKYELGYARNHILPLTDSSQMHDDEAEEGDITSAEGTIAVLSEDHEKALAAVQDKQTQEKARLQLIKDRIGMYTEKEDMSIHSMKEAIIETEKFAEINNENAEETKARMNSVLEAAKKREQNSKAHNTAESSASEAGQLEKKAQPATAEKNTETKLASSSKPKHTSKDEDTPTVEKDEPDKKPKLKRARKCYICKEYYNTVHFFYDTMCERCGDFNYAKRKQLGDLTGKLALVTGARVKIGYHTVLRLLRSGATVIATTRFPKDAASRYSKEEDYDKWKDNLKIYGLDLRHIPSVHYFCDFVKQKYEKLDILINNAAQTLKRKPNFFAHLLPIESKAVDELPENLQHTIGKDWEMDFGEIMDAHEAVEHHTMDEDTDKHHESDREKRLRLTAPIPNIVAARNRFPNLSQSALMCQVGVIAPGDPDPTNFPEGSLDLNGEQIDLSETNTWVREIDDTDIVEFMEVQTINTTAPWILIKELKPLMSDINSLSYIINVSSMEGKFYRKGKTKYHPGNNMSKAALNMLTRTLGESFAAEHGIYMVSTDTGFNTQEIPMQRMLFAPNAPLDEEDGAARILDPIFTGEKTGTGIHSQFLKDYRISYW